jgi:hypothetical protein
MPFSIRSYQRFPVQCAVIYNAGSFQGHGTIWNLSVNGWRLSGDLPMRPGETLSLRVTLPNEPCIDIPQAVSDGHGVRSLPARRSWLSNTRTLGSSIM